MLTFPSMDRAFGGLPNREQSLLPYRQAPGHLNRRARVHLEQDVGASGISGAEAGPVFNASCMSGREKVRPI